MDNQKNIYRFDVDYGRQGSIDGMFVATQAQVDQAMGQQCYFGEVLGKHSDVVFDLEPEHIEKIKDLTPEFVAKFEELGLENGFDPLDYAECRECEEPRRECGCDDG